MTVSGATMPAARYESVKLYVLEHIRTGEWDVGHRLPSENDLVDLLGVSRMTVHRALRELSSEGFVTRMQGVGSFVARPVPRPEFLELRDIAEDIAASGHEHSARVISLDVMRADMELASAFEQRLGYKLFHSVILHLEDAQPLQIEERFVSPHFAPDYLDQDFTHEIPYRHLQGIAGPDEVEHAVFAITPNARLCDLLALTEPEACLQLVRRTWVNGLVVTKSLFTCPGTRYSLGSRYSPNTRHGPPDR